MKIEPGMIIDGEKFYVAGEKLRFIVDDPKQKIHDCIFRRAHPHQIAPDVMVIRVKSLSGEKYSINANHVLEIRRLEE